MRLPYTGKGKKTEQQIVQFAGINRTENVKPGELRDAMGLSTAEFPCLTQRENRGVVEAYADAADLFSWDGKLLAVVNGKLLYDGEDIGDVTPGKKQWAVVNTKLCIFPDKVYIDLTNGTMGRLDASVKAIVDGRTPLTVTGHSLTASVYAKVREVIDPFVGNAATWTPALYTYGTDREAVKACWNGTAKTWAFPAGMEKLSGIWITGDTPGNVDRDSSGSGGLIGQIFIPENGFKIVSCNANTGALPDKSQYNKDGYYGVITGWDGEHVTNIEGNSNARPVLDIYQVGRENVLFSGVFDVGDVVDITRTPYGICDREKLAINGIEDSTNTLSFAEGTFDVPLATFQVAETITKGQLRQLKYDGNYYVITLDRDISAGLVLLLPEDKKRIQIWDPERKELDGSVHIDYVYQERVQGVSILAMEAYTLSDAVHIQRVVPDLDFICESGNRLWGVSNVQTNKVYNPETKEYDTYTSRCIYASALGKPTQFWTFAGTDTDSYQVAVGSEGDFTAICAYGNAVCCWKQDRLHKILGSYPSEYYMTTYGIDGVEKGSERSLTVINETLYYKGVSGVYAYGGGTPSLISYPLGRKQMTGGVGGVYKGNYYLDVICGEEAQLLCYDLRHGLWMKEDGLRAVAFANADGTMYLLNEDGTVLQMGADTEPPFQWTAEFAPMDASAHNQKGYSKLRLRMDMEPGAWLKIELREDNGPWKLVWTQRYTGAVTVNIPLMTGRCDRVAIRLNGKGRVTLRSMVREFTVESEET